jgi:hypothetical protein
MGGAELTLCASLTIIDSLLKERLSGRRAGRGRINPPLRGHAEPGARIRDALPHILFFKTQLRAARQG